MKDQNIMALFTILNSKLVLDETNKYFMLQRKEELGKLWARLQPTIIILTNVSFPKKILDLVTPHIDSYENEDSLTFDNSLINLCRKDHNSQNLPQNSPYVGRFLEMFNLLQKMNHVNDWYVVNIHMDNT